MVNIKLLRQIISDSGLSISWIAAKLGVSRQTLYNKLHGKTEFKPSELAILVQILHLGKHQIFGGTL